MNVSLADKLMVILHTLTPAINRCGDILNVIPRQLNRTWVVLKRIMTIIIAIFMLCGCTHSEGSMDKALSLRERIINGSGCQFDVVITADYQNEYYSFRMNCQTDKSGNVTFEILEPESISGITGSVSAEKGKLTFDDQILIFPTLTEGQITPVSAPWLFINTLRSGYITGCAQQGNGLQIMIKDSYAAESLQLNIQTVDDIPVFSEIIWQNRCVVTMNVEAFRIL